MTVFALGETITPHPEGGDLRGAFLDRALRAIQGLSRELDSHQLRAAVSAPTDADALLAALSAAPALGLETAADPLARARLRGLAASRELLRTEGEPWSAQAVADHLNISRQAVAKRAANGRLLALDTGRHGQAYPAWQFVRAGVLPGLAEALAVLQGHDPWMRLSFFLGQNDRLADRRPLDLLRMGDEASLRAVVTVARAPGRQAAT